MLSQEFECVEPELGEELDARPLSEMEPGRRERLEAHLEICHACRQRYGFEEAVARLMAEGVGVPDGRRARVIALPSRRRLLAVAALSLAAGLILALFLGPSEHTLLLPAGDALERSLDADFHILRPFEGEVLSRSGGNLTWTPVAGATSYKVEVKSVNGAFSWSAQVADAALALPEGGERDGDYLAIVKPLPRNLTREGEYSVYFQRGGFLKNLGYRIMHLPLASFLALVIGVAAGLLALRRS